MRLLFLTLIMAANLLSCSGQSNSKAGSGEFVFAQVGWKIDVPPGFTIMDSGQIKAMNSKGATAIGETYDTTLDFSATQTLISFNKGQFNSFTGTITPFDPGQDGDWNEADSALKYVIVETLQGQAPGTQIDTSSSVEKIGGLEFRKFQVIATFPNKMVINTIIYSRLHKGYDFGITITYADDKIGKELAAILALSKFDK